MLIKRSERNLRLVKILFLCLMLKLAVVIITYNEEKNIGRCLDSVAEVADEVVVVDSFSTDRTRTIAVSKGARVLEHPFDGHIEQKNWAIQQAAYPFILSLDADEALDDVLKSSIQKIKETDEPAPYAMNRLSYYGGQWIKHSGWYPDRKLRLWPAKAGHWAGTNPHDRFELYDPTTSVQVLPGNILHYSYYTLSEHVLRANQYSRIAALALYRQGVKISPPMIILKALARFIKAYILKGGYRGGIYGWIICSTTAYEVFLKYARLYLLWQGQRDFVE